MKQTRLSYILCTRWQEERQQQSQGRVERWWRALWCEREGDGSHLRSGRDEKILKPLLSRTIDKRNYVSTSLLSMAELAAFSRPR